MASPDDKEDLKKTSNNAVPIECSIPGKRSYTIRGSTFTVDERYEVKKAIGVGAYGLVTAAVDTRTGKQMAMKKISGVFDDLVDAKRVLREIRLMKSLDHPNILPICDMEAPESLDKFDEVYIASPLFAKDLSRVLEANVKLTDEHYQYFVYQILCALKYMHGSSILHRDLKPANLLITEECDLVICDFGLARHVDEEEVKQQEMTEYVVTRWYRAPELVLTHEYTNAVDLWALGCIMGDLLGRKILFPGKDFKNQVEIICQVLGKPQGSDLTHVKSDRARRFIEQLPESTGVNLTELYPDANPDAIDLMKKLLQFNPEKRISAAEALQHPYVKQYHDPEFETAPECDIQLGGLEPKADGDGGSTLTPLELRKLMLKEIYQFRPDATVFSEHPELKA